MAYSTSMETVKRMENYLSVLLNAKSTIEFESNDPKLAYKIRDAINAANYNDSKYGGLLQKYKFKQRKGKVIAELIEGKIDKTLGAHIRILGDLKLFEIISTCIDLSTANISFPDVNSLPEEDQQKLSKWCATAGYKYEFTPHLMMTKL